MAGASGDETPTVRQRDLSPAGERIKVDIEDPEAVAGFLEAIAGVIRRRRRVNGVATIAVTIE